MDEEDGQVRWKQQLCLSHIRLRSSSLAVLEVHFKPLVPAIAQEAEPKGAGVEVVAWAFTKIMQVGQLCPRHTLASTVDNILAAIVAAHEYMSYYLPKIHCYLLTHYYYFTTAY